MNFQKHKLPNQKTLDNRKLIRSSLNLLSTKKGNVHSLSRPLCSLTTFRSFDLIKNRNSFKMQDVSRINPALRTQVSNTEFSEKVFQNS